MVLFIFRTSPILLAPLTSHKLWNKLSFFIVVFIFSMFTKVPSAALVVGAGVLGVLFSVLSSKFKWTWSKAPIPEKKKEDEQEEGGEE